MVFLWYFKLCTHLKLFSHESHLYEMLPWTVLICFFSWDFLETVVRQSSQENLTFSCIVFTCSSRDCFLAKLLRQRSHSILIDSSWFSLLCLHKLEEVLKTLLHISHVYEVIFPLFNAIFVPSMTVLATH